MIDVTRGDMVESRHACRAVIAKASGEIVDSWGDADSDIYPRSAIKPLQALPLLETGAAAAHGLSDQEVALACSSHMSQAFHRDTVRAWLGRMGLAADDLECGGHLPRDDEAAEDAIRNGDLIDQVFNNCSGKHSGFLTTAVHMGEPTRGYSDADHPVQRRLAATLAHLGGVTLANTARGIDGCGIPVIGMPLSALARAVARLADPESLDRPQADAARRIFSAMTTHPAYVRGTHGFDTLIMQAGRGAFATKTGAEGVHIAIIPSRGLGVAVKVEDGAGRASGVALCALLDYLDLFDARAKSAAGDLMDAPITNAAGKPVGCIRPAPDWRD